MIIVCLSIYNGERFLHQQLISLENQSSDFSLIIRDDGSTDQSYEILKKSLQNLSLQIQFLDNRINLGIKESFELLMYEAVKIGVQYIMFCDQDDVWHTDKIEKTYRKMEELENWYGQDMPILVHSDLIVVDKNLKVIAPSFWKYQNIDPDKDSFNRLLLQNTVTGCTMMINRALAEKVKTIPQEAIMHDWWIAMVASVFGKIAHIDEPLILYRQHSSNDTGAKHYGLRYFIKKFLTKPSFEKYIDQSKAFLTLYDQELDEYNKSMLEEFSRFHTLSKFQKLRVLFKYNIWKNGFMRNVGLVLFA